MKWITKLIILSFVLTVLSSCSEYYSYTDKKNLNIVLNNLSSGDFYSCSIQRSFSLGHKNYPKGLITKKLEFKPNENINLEYTSEIIGLIYKKDQWDHGNSLFNINKNAENEYYLGSFYADSDYDDKIMKKDYKLVFNKKTLKVNLFNKYIQNEYSCQQLHKILSEAMKKQILKNFLLQHNQDRL